MNFQKEDLLYLIYGLIICMFVGIYWWSLPYEKLNMEDAFVQWSIFIIVASFIFRYFLKLGTYKLIVSSVIGIEMVIVVRYIFDKLNDSTRDPQIFFVLIVAFFIGVISSGAGIFLANQLISKGKNNEDSRSKTEIESTKKESKNNKPSDSS